MPKNYHLQTVQSNTFNAVFVGENINSKSL